MISFVIKLQNIYLSVLCDVAITIGGKKKPCVLVDIQSTGAFDEGENSAYVKPLMEYLMAKFNLPVER